MAPAVSQAQYRFMKSVAEGDAKARGLSKEDAKEYTTGNVGAQSYNHLPKIKKMIKNKSQDKK